MICLTVSQLFFAHSYTRWCLLYTCREINNFSLCFKVGNISSTRPTTSEESSKSAEQAAPDVPARQESTKPAMVTTLDNVKFKLNENNDGQKLLQKVSHVLSSSVKNVLIC